MSLVSELAQPPSSQDADRNLTLLGYGLLFFAIFFAGVPALIAVAMAYARRREVDRGLRSHLRFQIYIFWVGFALTALATLSGLAAVLSAIVEMVDTAMGARWRGWGAFTFHNAHFHGPVAAFSIAAVGLGIMTGLWLLAASCYGFIRLAMHRPVRPAVA